MASILARGATNTLRAITNVLPRHTKRLVLWSVLYTRMCGDNKGCCARNLTKEQCVCLNKAMSLCKDNNALELPAKLGKFLWPDLEECTAVARTALRGEKPAEVAAKDFIRSVPSWLRYASDAFMLRDFQLLMASPLRTVA